MNAITSEQIEAIVPPSTGYHKCNWNGLELAIRPFLSFAEMTTMHDMIMEMCTDPKTKQPMPEVMDFAMRIAVIHFYTNIQVLESQELAYALVYRTDIFDRVMKYVSAPQWAALTTAIKAELNMKE